MRFQQLALEHHHAARVQFLAIEKPAHCPSLITSWIDTAQKPERLRGQAETCLITS